MATSQDALVVKSSDISQDEWFTMRQALLARRTVQYGGKSWIVRRVEGDSLNGRITLIPTVKSGR
jgi:hypothetical protein